MAEKAKNNNEIIFILITLVLMIGFGFIPPVLDLTASGMRILGVLFGVIFGCSFCSSTAWPCLFGMVVLIMTGVSNATAILNAGIGNDSIWLMTFFFIFVAVLEEAQITGVMANWIISMKIIRKRPWVYLFILMFGTFFVGAIGLSFPAMILFWNILMKTCKEFGVKPYSAYPTVGFIGIAIAGLASSSLWTFMGNPLFVSAMLSSISGGVFSLNTGIYALFSLLLWLVLFSVYILLFKFIMRVDVSNLKDIDAPREKGTQLSKRQKAILVYTALVLVMYCGKGLVPATSGLGVWLSGLGSSFPLILVIALMCITRVEGAFLCDFSRAARNGVVWDTVILAGSLLALSTIMMTTDTGVQETILRVLSPIFAGHGLVFMTVIICVVSVILTNFMANTTVGLMFTPVIFSFSQTMGFNPLPVIAIMTISIHVAYMTPAASPYASLLFGYSSEWVKKGDLYKYGLISCVAITAFMLLVGIPLSKFMF